MSDDIQCTDGLLGDISLANIGVHKAEIRANAFNACETISDQMADEVTSSDSRELINTDETISQGRTTR